MVTLSASSPDQAVKVQSAVQDSGAQAELSPNIGRQHLESR